jgi:hypothetical protein
MTSSWPRLRSSAPKSFRPVRVSPTKPTTPDRDQDDSPEDDRSLNGRTSRVVATQERDDGSYHEATGDRADVHQPPGWKVRPSSHTSGQSPPSDSALLWAVQSSVKAAASHHSVPCARLSDKTSKRCAAARSRAIRPIQVLTGIVLARELDWRRPTTTLAQEHDPPRDVHVRPGRSDGCLRHVHVVQDPR